MTLVGKLLPMASPTLPISICEVNSLSDAQFEKVFGNVIELCTDAAVNVKKKRPFQDVSALCSAFQRYLEEIGVEGKDKSNIRPYLIWVLVNKVFSKGLGEIWK